MMAWVLQNAGIVEREGEIMQIFSSPKGVALSRALFIQLRVRMSGRESRIVDVPRMEMVQTTERGMVRLSTESGHVEPTGGGERR